MSSITYDMEMDLMRNWFFTPPSGSTVPPIRLYQYQQDGTAIEKILLYFPKKKNSRRTWI